MRCAYSVGGMGALRQCPEEATHQRVYPAPANTRKPCCFKHRYAEGDDETNAPYEIEEIPVHVGSPVDLGDEVVKLHFAPPAEVEAPGFVIREPEIAVPTLLLLLVLADCSLWVKAGVSCDELGRTEDEDRCPVCRMKDTVKEYVTIPERSVS